MSSNHFRPVEMKGSRQLGGIIVIDSLDDCQYGRMRRTDQLFEKFWSRTDR